MDFIHFKTAAQFRRAAEYSSHLAMARRLAMYRRLAARALAELARERGTGVTDLLTEEREFTCVYCGIRRYHLPGEHDQCDHSPTGECSPVEPGKKSAPITTVKGRAFRGDPVPIKSVVSKQELGKIGENLVLRLTGAKRMNGEWNNFPIDLVKGDTVYEVKAGLASNSPDAQKWRLTIGEPGKKEKAWLAKASDNEKEKWNDRKNKMILERKQKVMTELEKKIGRQVKAKTIAFIVNPDRKVADVYEFDGFHPVIRWRSPQAAAGYRRTVKYG